MLEVALSNMEAVYEMASPQYALPVCAYEMSEISPYAIANSLEAEQEIYETPFEDEDSYGPIYYEPPSNLQKIYEEFEGKRFRKLYHHQIRFDITFLFTYLVTLKKQKLGNIELGKMSPIA